MREEIKPIQVLLLWHLLAEGGGDWLKNVKGTASAPANRRRLLQLGLVEESKQKAPGGRVATLHYALTETGWAWAAEHLDAALPPRALTAPLLRRVMQRLDAYLQASGVSLAEFVTAPATGSVEGPEPPVDLTARIREAYFRLTRGRPNVRVLLRDLRSALRDAERSALDSALLRMAREGAVALYRLDDPQSVTAEDREAALHTPAGDARHLVYMER